LLGRYPEVPWSAVVGMRNRLAHSFDAICFDIGWDAVDSHAPALPCPVLSFLMVRGQSEAAGRATGRCVMFRRGRLTL
jgi:uncharacterized protein with HEPN domain